MAYVLESLVLSTVRCFCVAQRQKGVADAVIEADARIVKIFEFAFPLKVMLLSSPALRLVFHPHHHPYSASIGK